MVDFKSFGGTGAAGSLFGSSAPPKVSSIFGSKPPSAAPALFGNNDGAKNNAPLFGGNTGATMFSGDKKTDPMATMFANRKTDADSKGPFGNQGLAEKKSIFNPVGEKQVFGSGALSAP